VKGNRIYKTEYVASKTK